MAKIYQLFYRFSLILVAFCLIRSCNLSNQNSTENSTQDVLPEVNFVGAMKNVMWKGELFGTINLDTISDKKNLYGLGPVEYLTGEILVIDGKAYRSTVVDDSTMLVEETWQLKAPFFVYGNVPNWTEYELPQHIQTIKQLETYLDSTTQNLKRPFAFRLNGIVETATIHIVNLPHGTKVSSPDEAHQGQVNYYLTNEPCDIVGFFSTKHQAIFTHHDSYVHMHLITSDKSKMGHLDEVLFKKGTMNIFLP